ncbi:MAG: sugar ABC transporter permease [Treponema sp.]|jgi:sn-glycerol 3-phosphate transport system permease protein|nr:sugar ABC transporter permease [Treponema sp.]
MVPLAKLRDGAPVLFGISRSGKLHWKPYILLLPILFFALGFVYYPFFRTFVYSFSRVNFNGGITGFAGLNNFRRLFRDAAFAGALKNTLRLAFTTTPLNLFCSLGLALLAVKKRKTGILYETMFMMPMALSMPAASQIFKLLLEPSMGVLNYFLGLQIGWFGDPKTAMYGIVMVCLWIGIPFDFLLFLAALRNIPAPFIEAAALDGAGYFRRFLRIQIPLIAPTILYVVCTNLVLAMMTSTPVMIITGGQPGRSTETLIFMMYTSGYQSSNYSLASCISIVTFALTFGMVLLAMFFERRGIHYE